MSTLHKSQLYKKICLVCLITCYAHNPLQAQVTVKIGKPYCQFVSIDNGNSCLTFNDDVNFTFIEQGDLTIGGRYASGTYIIKDGNLTLNFSQTELPLTAKTEVRKWINDKDSIKIKFKIINHDDWCGKPECVQYLIDSVYTKPNRDWGAEFIFKKSETPIKITVFSLYTYTNDFIFNGTVNSEIKLDVYHHKGEAIYDQIENAKILNIENDMVTGFELANGTKFFLRE
ncbi:MAG: hypothetical protein RQ735_08270 [Flavobacteriaceae bacterium]|nr:hypothetical protein [Flavobacteriaceae bacterium]